jgi:putative transposase
MLACLLRRVLDTGRALLSSLRHRVLAATKPSTAAPLAGVLADLLRSKPELLAENALLRQQLLILRRSIKRPRCRPADRALLVLLASRVQAWRQALLIVQPDTLLRWHRQLFSVYWRRKSRATPRARRAKVSGEAIALIREMATANRLWGAERIRGELL